MHYWDKPHFVIMCYPFCIFSAVQSLGHVWLFVSPWTAACQASLSITNTQNLPKLMSIESMMPSNHFILCHPLLLLPSIIASIRRFSKESIPRIRWPSIGVSASASVLPKNIQDCFPLGWTGWKSLLSKGLSRVFSISSVQFSSVTQSYPTLCNPMNCSTSGLPVHH